MTMNPTNFGRQFKKSLPTYFKRLFERKEESKHASVTAGLYQYVGELSEKAVRFILPDGGEILEDNEFKAILRLPFPVIALEYFENESASEGLYESTKRMVIAFEVPDGDGFYISIMPVSWIDVSEMWQPFPPISLRTGAQGSDLRITTGTNWGLKCHHPNHYADYVFDMGDYMNEALALFSFLNALACSNITTEKVPRKGPLNPSGMIPFDEYHVLTLPSQQRGEGSDKGGSHRSPREHMRRGHIRRLTDSRRIWVNATIVNCGIGAKINKHYSLRNR